MSRYFTAALCTRRCHTTPTAHTWRGLTSMESYDRVLFPEGSRVRVSNNLLSSLRYFRTFC